MTTALSTRPSRALQSLFGRDPFAGFQEEMENLMSRFRGDWNGDWPAAVLAPSTVFAPSIDLEETDDALQVRMDVPGLKAEEIDIEVSGNTLRVSGEHKEEKEEKGKTYHRLERRRGAFARALILPATVKQDQINAVCDNGVLTITLPKTEAAQTRKIAVKSNGK